MKVLSFDQLVSLLRDLAPEQPRVVISGNSANPATLIEALMAARDECRVFQLNAPDDFSPNPAFITETPFVGPGMRHDPMLDYLPMRLSLVPRLFSTVRPVDAVLIHTSLPHGNKVSLGIEVNILPAAIEQVRSRGGLVIAQMNARMPYTFGDAEIPLEFIDGVIEVDTPLMSPRTPPADDSAHIIGERIAPFAEDGTTLQLGIGEIPTVAATQMSHLRQLRVWSEMISDGVLTLCRAGALDPDHPVICSFLIGSQDLYEWAHRNETLWMRRTEIVNDPSRIAAQANVLSINAAMQVDLFAQANASYVNNRIHSGFGGQPDFVTGALHSRGGHAIVALRAWHQKTDASTVVPILEDPVTSFQHSAIVSEYGSANLFGRSQHAQAKLIIDEVADPRARPALVAAAGRLGLSREID